MNKYKIAGVVNFLLGIGQTTLSAILLIFVLPKLTAIFSQLDVNIQSKLNIAYSALMLILIMGSVNLFFSIKSFKETKDKERYFKYGLLFATMSFFLVGVLMSIANLNIISPMYNLTSRFQAYLLSF